MSSKLNSQFILVSDGEWAWAMSYRPEEDKLYIQRRDGSRIIVESANGFGSVFPKQSYASREPKVGLRSGWKCKSNNISYTGVIELNLENSSASADIPTIFPLGVNYYPHKEILL